MATLQLLLVLRPSLLRQPHLVDELLHVLLLSRPDRLQVSVDRIKGIIRIR